VSLEATFERELARDRELLRFFNYGTLGWSVLTVAMLMTLVIPMGRTSPWLILISVYAISTRLGVLLARGALAVPRFLLRINDDDPETRAAARAVFERHRPGMTKALRAGSRSAGELTYDEAARLAAERRIASRRRTGVVLVATWTAITVAILVLLIRTGGGPTN